MVRFITKNGKHIPIDNDKPRTSSNGRNDESEGMSIGSGTRIPSNLDDDLTPEQEKKTLDILNLLDDSLSGGLDNQGLKLQKEIGKDIAETDPSGDTFFQGGKAFKVELNPSLGIIAVDERFQDKDGNWQTGKNIFFAQGEDGQDIADDAGGFFVDTIMEFLDSSGSLEGAR